MKKQFFLFLLFFQASLVFAQEKRSISGYVRDASSGEGLIGVSVYVPELKMGVSTNVYGFYSLSLPQGSYQLSFTYIGFQKEQKNINLETENQKFDVELKEDSKLLNEVVVSSKREDDNVKNIEMSVNKMDMKTVQRIPALLGEVDVVRSIQLLPGVSTVGEGATGFNVRGGNIDQNLVLLDEAPVYNSSHLFGFFSVFNPDAVKDLKLIKGGIPAEYGGRLSSILDVRMKEGNAKKTSVSGGIGTIFSRITLEQPIIKDKASCIVALRRSYIDVLAKPFLSADLKGSQFYFYDFTAKANYKINNNNTVFASGYFGRDVFGANFGFEWGNGTTSARWNHVFNNKLFLNTTVFYSQYDYRLQTDLKEENKQDSFRWNSQIKNNSVKADFTFYPSPKHTLTFGGQGIFYRFSPGEAQGITGGFVQKITLDKKYATEGGIYVGNEQKLSDRIQLQYGLRYSYYNWLGSGTKYILGTATKPLESKPVKNVESYTDGQSMQQYGYVEPRFSAKIDVSSSSSIKVSYNRLAQYLHLLSNTAAASPLDVWVPSSNNIKPQVADQVALGFFKNIADNDYETSVEVYYKALQNQIDYLPDADLLLNPLVEADLLNGEGRAYGAEFYVKKNKGKLNGWISYTLARTERKVPQYNAGTWFPSRFDRLHNLSVVSLYDLTKKWSLSANFSFSSGTPATFPTDKYTWQGYAVGNNYLAEKNTYRIPNYHRLDVSATRRKESKWFGKKGETELVLSVYNAYNRKNPYSVFVRQNEKDPSKTEAVQFSVFGSIIPAVTYNFKF